MVGVVSLTVIAACPQSLFGKDSRQAGMTIGEILFMAFLIVTRKEVDKVTF